MDVARQLAVAGQSGSVRACIGGWAPLWRSSSERLALRRIERTVLRCLGSALWEAQATASSSLVSPKASAAPEKTSGSAWKGFAEDRRWT